MSGVAPKRRTNQRIRFDRGKFKALVHYTCWRCEDPRILGPVRLSRVLWHTDRIQYLRAGQPVTGATYVKHQSGPAAKPLSAVVAELEKEGAVATRDRSYGGDTTQYFARHEPDISAFTPNEISVVDSAIEAVCFRGTPSPVDTTADASVWKLARIGETLPYYTVFAARPAELMKRDMDWAVEHVRRGTNDPDLKELDELARLNPRIEEAYAALEWHLTRDSSAGVPLPVVNTSFFLYKQRGNSPSTLPSIAAVYTIDLDELAICRLKFGFDEEDEDSFEALDAEEREA